MQRDSLCYPDWPVSPLEPPVACSLQYVPGLVSATVSATLYHGRMAPFRLPALYPRQLATLSHPGHRGLSPWPATSLQCQRRRSVFTTCNEDVGPMSRGSPTPMDPTHNGVSLSPPLPCYHPPLSLTCGSWCPAGGPPRSGHLQPGRGFGTRRNHSVSRAVLRRPERGCCSPPS